MSNHALNPQQLQDRLILFGIAVCRSIRDEPGDAVRDYFTGQLLRSGTSPAAHYAEARDAESRRDFVHKIKICLKELRESVVWLRYLLALSSRQQYAAVMKESHELIAILTASLKTARGSEPSSR